MVWKDPFNSRDGNGGKWFRPLAAQTNFFAPGLREVLISRKIEILRLLTEVKLGNQREPIQFGIRLLFLINADELRPS